MPGKSPLFRGDGRLSLLGRASAACRGREPCQRAAGAGLPGGETAPLVSILPGSSAGNYTQIKNVSKSNFSSSQVWAETCDLVPRGRKEPRSLRSILRPGGKAGCCTPQPCTRGPTEGSQWATLLHPHPPPLPPQLQAAGPCLNPGSSLHGGI